jgi:hypothetical protein
VTGLAGEPLAEHVVELMADSEDEVRGFAALEGLAVTQVVHHANGQPESVLEIAPRALESPAEAVTAEEEEVSEATREYVQQISNKKRPLFGKKLSPEWVSLGCGVVAATWGGLFLLLHARHEQPPLVVDTFPGAGLMLAAVGMATATQSFRKSDRPYLGVIGGLFSFVVAAPLIFFWLWVVAAILSVINGP